MQGKELQNTLGSVLAAFPVVVRTGKGYVEACHQVPPHLYLTSPRLASSPSALHPPPASRASLFPPWSCLPPLHPHTCPSSACPSSASQDVNKGVMAARMIDLLQGDGPPAETFVFCVGDVRQHVEIHRVAGFTHWVAGCTHSVAASIPYSCRTRRTSSCSRRSMPSSARATQGYSRSPWGASHRRWVHASAEPHPEPQALRLAPRPSLAPSPEPRAVLRTSRRRAPTSTATPRWSRCSSSSAPSASTHPARRSAAAAWAAWASAWAVCRAPLPEGWAR